MENLGKVTLFIVVIVAAFFTSLLGAYIVLSIANLYKISLVSGMSFIQVYGVLTIFTIVMYKYVPKEEGDKTTDVISKAVIELSTRVLFLLLSWGLAFLTYAIIA